MRLAALPALCALLVVACGNTPASSTTPATASATVAPTPSASLPPDTERLDIVAKGVGAYMLVAVPVAIVHSAAGRTAATGVVVHFSVKRGGRAIFALDSPAVRVLAGETLVITANCTDQCNVADGVEATVTVAHWAVVGGSPIGVDVGRYRCGGGCGGHGHGDVATTLHGDGLVVNTPVNAFAACTTAAGAIVGGGQRQLTWPQNGGSLAVDVPVIVSAQPAICRVSASPPSSTSG